MTYEILTQYFTLVPLNGKIPIVKGWNTRTKSDLEAYCEKHTGNFGIACGRQSGIIVIDCDIPRENTNSSNGNDDWQLLLEKYNNGKQLFHDNCVEDKSGSGGRRLYFRYKYLPDNLEYVKKIDKMNIDVLGNDKLCVAPGSIYQGCCKLGEKKHKCKTNNPWECLFQGNRYEWVNAIHRTQLQEIPEWLFNLITREKRVVVKREPVVITNQELRDIYTMFDNLDQQERFTEFNSWRNSIWLMCKLGLTDNQIQELSSKADNYCEKSTQQLIDSFNEARFEGGFDTLKLMLMKDNNKLFKKLFPPETEDDNLPIVPIKIEPLKTISETINKNNVGSYLTRFNDDIDTICLRSNMMTHKSQNLKELFSDITKKVLIVYPRVSLCKSMVNEFKSFGFKLYSDCISTDGFIYANRVVVCMDSLHKIMGNFDYLILDEMVYTLSHLCSFVKYKTDCFRVLKQYIRDTQRVIACDALLDNTCVELLQQLRGRERVCVVENQYQSFTDRTYEIIKDKTRDQFSIVNDIILELVNGRKLAVATSSKKFGEKLRNNCIKHDINVLFISADTDFVDVDKWNNYQCLIYTPTIAMGVSFNELYFDKTIGYFDSNSCSAEYVAQMLLRVRNVVDKKMTIYTKTKKCFLPTEDYDLDEFLTNQDNFEMKSGLKMNNTKRRVIKNRFYDLVKNNKKMEHKSQVDFNGILTGLLQLHGITDVNERPKMTEKINDNVKQQLQDNYEEILRQDTQLIIDADDITQSEFNRLDNKHETTVIEKRQILKFKFKDCFNGMVVDVDNLLTYTKKMKQFRNVKYLYLMGINHIRDDIKNMVLARREMSDFDRTINLNRKNHLLKIFWCCEIYKAIGFESPFCDRTIDNINYGMLKKFLVKNSDAIDIVFGGHISRWRKNTGWEDLDENDSKVKRKMSMYINSKIVSTFGFGKVIQKGGRTKTYEIDSIRNNYSNYGENGLVLFKKKKIKREKNDNYDDLLSFVKEISNV